MKLKMLLASLLALFGTAQAMAAAPVEGKDYTRLSNPGPGEPGKIVITEFFSYQCPHCYMFAKPFAAWVRTLPADVKVERVPVGLGRQTWEPAARAYLAYGALQLVSRMDDATFDAIHRKGIRLETEPAFAQWVGTQGVDAKRFAAELRSFNVETQLKAGELKARNWQLPSIPTLVVDGRYMVTILDNGSFQPQLAVVNELIAKVRKEKGGK